MNTVKIYNNMHTNATRTTLLIDDGDVMRKVNGSTHEILQRGQTTALGSRERHSEKLEKEAKLCAANGIRPEGKRLKRSDSATIVTPTVTDVTTTDSLHHLFIFTFALQKDNLSHIALQLLPRRSANVDATYKAILSRMDVSDDGEWPVLARRELIDDKNQVTFPNVSAFVDPLLATLQDRNVIGLEPFPETVDVWAKSIH